MFTIGAAIPVIPWLFIGGGVAVTASTIASAVGLFGVGAVTTLFTGRSVLVSGGRMLGLGLAAAAATFGIGKLVGVSVGV
jgi:VIT1/CCC1 family predicted Fe2+/Mn2+ transporter